jgi:hypothetical protein
MATHDGTVVSLGDIGALRLKVGGSMVGEPPINPLLFVRDGLYNRCSTNVVRFQAHPKFFLTD